MTALDHGPSSDRGASSEHDRARDHDRDHARGDGHAPGHSSGHAHSSVHRLLDEYASGQDVDPAAYATFVAAYSSAVAAYLALYRRSGRRLPEGPSAGDMALLGTATFKLSRLIAKDKVTSFLRFPFTRYKGNAPGPEVSEEPRGEGLRRRVGELISCPFCVGQWAGTAVGGHAVWR
jgi:hypothetical protein